MIKYVEIPSNDYKMIKYTKERDFNTNQVAKVIYYFV